MCWNHGSVSDYIGDSCLHDCFLIVFCVCCTSFVAFVELMFGQVGYFCFKKMCLQPFTAQ